MIKTNIKVTITDFSDSQNGIYTPGIHLTSTEDGSIMLDVTSNRISLDPKDLKEALNILEEFTQKNTPIEAVKSTMAVEFG